MVISADKGRAMVAMNKSDYLRKVAILLNDNESYSDYWQILSQQQATDFRISYNTLTLHSYDHVTQPSQAFMDYRKHNRRAFYFVPLELYMARLRL